MENQKKIARVYIPKLSCRLTPSVRHECNQVLCVSVCVCVCVCVCLHLNSNS